MQQSRKVGERPTHAKGKHDDAHVLDGGIGKHALDIAPPIQHESRENKGEQPHRDHQRAWRQRAWVHCKQHLEAQQRVERDVEQQPREHCRDRRRPLGMCIGKPGMERGQPDLGTVAEQQKNESDVQELRAEAAGFLDQRGPHHGIGSLADHRSGRHVNEDRSEQCKGDAESLVSAIDSDHQHCRQCGEFDSHPHKADVVCGEP